MTDEEQWILPNFAMVNNQKTSTKVRIVFDPAAKLGLNDAIHSGPKLQRELVDVLTRFRREPVALSSNISQMFLQVGLAEKDRPFHRFLWRGLDQTKEPKVYEFTRLPFRNTASPLGAQHALHTHAESNKEFYPEAADTVDNAMYVDDVLDSCETIPEAKVLRKQMTELLSEAGFTLKKWMSNEVEVIKDVPIEDRLPGFEIHSGNLPTLKTLGVSWEADRDIWKRNMLSSVAKLFDPMLSGKNPTSEDLGCWN